MDYSEKKIEKMKQDFFLALKDVSKSVELSSQRTETGHYKLFSKDELNLIKKLRSKMKRAFDISMELQEINRFKDLHYLLNDPDPIVVIYYCKFNYPDYADEFVPILQKLYRDCPKGPYKVEIGQALDEFEKVQLEKKVKDANGQ